MQFHLWHHSEDLATLLLFSDVSTDEEKQAIINALQQNPLPKNVCHISYKIPTIYKLILANLVMQ